MAFRTLNRGYALRGVLWPGGGAEEVIGATVVVDSEGNVATIAKDLELPRDLTVINVGWIGPAIIDAHVHMGFGSFDEQLARGVVAVRDLGAPEVLTSQWREDQKQPGPRPVLFHSGQLLTAPGGYPSRSWGADGYAKFVARPEDARAAVRDLVANQEVDLIKVALEPSGRAPVPDLETVRAVVQTAHELGYAVTCHALGIEMVRRALDAGVDELCHTPVELLRDDLVERIAQSETVVTSTIQTFVSGGAGKGAIANAAKLVAGGVRLIYGTDLGNAGTHEGIDTRELQRLEQAGLGVQGALRSATEGAARAPGIRQLSGRIEVGRQLRAIGLGASPLTAKDPWTTFESRPLVALGTWLQS